MIMFVSGFNIGDFIPGRTSMVTIVDPGYIQFEYTGEDARRIQYGMEAEVFIDDLPIRVKASVTFSTAPREDRERFRNTVVFTPVDPDDLPLSMRIGSRYEFSIVLDERTDVIVIPQDAASSFMGQYYVQVLEGGLRYERNIVVGLKSRTHMEVLNGLVEGETLILGIER
jgi:macrolide-specific efflux system membrane fusion protein